MLSTNYFYPDENKMIQFEVRPWNTNTEGWRRLSAISFTVPKVVNGHQGDINPTRFLWDGKREPGPKNSGDDPVVAHFTNFLDAGAFTKVGDFEWSC